MKSTKQELRRSQFVTVYGPGAIIEGPNGSRLIPSLKGLGYNCNDAFFKKYELKDIRMSHLLNEEDESSYENHLLEIPSNTSSDIGEKNIIYSTIVFPAWHVCYKRNPAILYYDKIYDEHCDAYNPQKCMDCDKENNPNVRFVRACPDGHLDEVYWKREVHGGDSTCDGSKYYYWRVNGSLLADIIIECPKCGRHTDMHKIYLNKTKCTGRLPEKEELKGYPIAFGEIQRNNNCDEMMSVVQKQSTSLRLPVTKTLLKIPQFDESVLDSLINTKMEGFLKGILTAKKPEDISKEVILKAGLDSLSSKDYKKLVKYLETHDVVDYINLLNKVDDRNPDFTSALEEEFKSLRGNEKESENFAKSDFFDYELKGLGYEFPLKVCGIEKLTTITAQLSYQRNPHTKKNQETGEIEEGEQVSVGYIDESTRKIWYPAFKGVGEGIFITSEENPFSFIDGLDEIKQLWENAILPTNKERPEITTPLFVWWHTLCHAIIKSLSLSCGYSSAALHERVYVDETTGKGGILIYNTSPGEDSGMGGLVDTVYSENEFKKVLKNAMNTLLVCSNDPLCSSIQLEGDKVNGSVCHNCLLLSETSCEHRNSFLDRHFFI